MTVDSCLIKIDFVAESKLPYPVLRVLGVVFRHIGQSQVVTGIDDEVGYLQGDFLLSFLLTP